MVEGLMGPVMCWIDVERPSCSETREVRARKQHDCCECNVPILPGAIYEVTSGVWDGRPDRYKTCVSCVALRERVIEHEKKNGCYGDEAVPPFGELLQVAEEYGLRDQQDVQQVS